MRKAAEIASAFPPKDLLNGRRSFFLVGIGGAGMSALARMLHHRGFSVSGSDSTRSPDTDRLQREGISVSIGHSGTPIKELDPESGAVVLTDAIDLDTSPEVAAAREHGIPFFRRSQALGWLLRGKKVIAVTGTHGKTTTTGMLGSALAAAGLDPLVVVGAAIPQFGGPVREGDGEWAVVEACEAYDSFHDLEPHDVVLTNLELDHVDFHGSFDNLKASVLRFVESLPGDGKLIYCAEDAGATEVADSFAGEKVGYRQNGSPPKQLAQPGRHNQLNFKGVIAAAQVVGADMARATEGASEFEGAERRLQLLSDGAVTVIDDYAHHPTEIAASLSALRERFSGRRIVVVYQPHLYSRTAPLIKEFAAALSLADIVVLTDIYPAREAPIAGVSSSRIAEAVSVPVHYVPSRHPLPIEVAKIVRDGDVVVGMGAGNISEFGPAFVQEIARPSKANNIAVIYGGDSAEREVSILSGLAIKAALEARGYRAHLVDVTEMLLKSKDISVLTGPNRPDLAFLAVHGTHAEDGAIQGFLELLHIPYTGSGIQASALAMDKALTKKLLDQQGISVPFGAHLTERNQSVPVKAPLIVKPNAQGSTVGLSFVEHQDDVAAAIERAFSYDREVLVEEWIRGMEISVPVLDTTPLPPVEIAPVSGFYDFESKYTPGATQEIVPARLPDHQIRLAQEIALKVHQTLGCAGATRTDMIVRGEEIFVLEINTLPGMTGTSLLPNSAKATGISFEDLCELLVEAALRSHAAKT
jgi:D-alanine--D-alanine ligase